MNSRIYCSEESTLRERRLIELGTGVAKGKNMAVVGLQGSGRDRVLSALYIDAFRQQGRFSAEALNANLLWVDMQNLHDPTPVKLYQLLLRTLFEQGNLLDPPLQLAPPIPNSSPTHSVDLFQLQSKLRELICQSAENGRRIVLLMDRFDTACGDKSAVVLEALNTLALGIESAISFVIGLSRDLLHEGLRGRLGQIQKRLDFNCIWIEGADSAETIATLTQQLGHLNPTPQQLEALATLSGGFPSLIDALANWWQETPVSAELPNTQHSFYIVEVQLALQALWEGLSFHERNLLHELSCIKPNRYANFVARHRSALQSLIRRGVLHDRTTLELFSPLLRIWINEMRHTIRGHVWFNEQNDTYYQGQRPLGKLSPRAEAALGFFLQHPQKKCEKDLLIAHIWETPYVTDDSVYQVVRELRRELEPNSRKPCYLLNHRSLRGGRYQFFPNGYEPYRV